MAGYSGTPLLQKLGYREGQRALLIGIPDDLAIPSCFSDFATKQALPMLAEGAALPPGPFDLIHVFETERIVLEARLADLRAALDPSGMIWVSWPKKASGLQRSLNEDTIREAALAGGLVDIKVCAVDAVWSGLKLVIPRALRP